MSRLRFELLDSLSLAGDSTAPNEDAFAADSSLAVVFDGATCLGGNLLPGPSDSQWIARFGARRLVAHAGSDAGMPRDWVHAAAADAAHSFSGLRRRVPEQRFEIPLAAMMMIAIVAQHLEALWFGDCGLIFEPPDGRASLIGKPFACRLQDRDRVRDGNQGRDAAAPNMRAEYLDAMRTARNATNRDDGIGRDDDWLFAPDENCADHASATRLECAPGATLLLATNGFLALVSAYERYNVQTLLRTASSDGLRLLGEQLRAIEAKDPKGTVFPRFKSSDDATALLLRVTD